MEAAAVSLSLSLSLQQHLPPPHHHRSSLPITILPQTGSRPRVCSSSLKPPRPASDSSSARSAQAFHPGTAHCSSSRATTGYAAALADACVRAGTLRRASRHARALHLLLLLPRHQSSSTSRVVVEQVEEPRVAALVRMLVGKGRAGMVAEVMAEFAAICDKLLFLLGPPTNKYHAY